MPRTSGAKTKPVKDSIGKVDDISAISVMLEQGQPSLSLTKYSIHTMTLRKRTRHSVKHDNTNRGVPHSWFKYTRTYSILLTVNACRATSGKIIKKVSKNKKYSKIIDKGVEHPL